ncbi:MAG: hypothetical protein HYV13_02730 [Candidatus Doudnabacteria bacterium]|nr:hypothetical protein [Candidatus Doudnabacteria bacterium]
MKPFVISEDAETLLHKWAEVRGFQLPSRAFFAGLLDEMVGMLEKIFSEVILAEEAAISSQLVQWVHASGLPAVSMDGVYFQSEHTIQVNRAVDQFGNDIGLFPRPGAPSLCEQCQVIKDRELTEIVLVDDVVFSGHQIVLVIEGLADLNVRVVKVLAGISIGMGETLLAEKGVDYVSVYPIPEVVDEICQRDFLPGTPRCGRYLAGSKNTGLPYLLPFGNPGKWASIPENWQLPFSQFCIDRAIRVFEAIEKESGRVVHCLDLDRKVFSLPKDGTRFVDALRRLL